MLHDIQKPRPAGRPYLPFLLLGILILFMGVSLGKLTRTHPVGADALGYVYSAQQLANGNNLVFSDSHNVDSGPYFFLHMFRMVKTGSTEATFCCPPGGPILFALGMILTGSAGAIPYVAPAMALLGILATFWFGWLVAQNKWVGLWAATILSGTALFWEFSTLALTNLPSLAFIMIGVSLFVLAQRENTKRTVFISLAAGLFIGFSFLIRYTNAILIGPSLVLYALFLRKTRLFGDKRQWAFWGIVALFSGSVLLYNWIYLGGPFNTVYSTPELGAYPWPMFSWKYAFGPSPANGYSAQAIAQTLWQNFYILLFLAPVGWMSMQRPYRALNVGIVLTTVTLYGSYAFAARGGNAQFLLPIFPFISLAIGLGITGLLSALAHNRLRWLLAGLILLLILAPIPAKAGELQKRNEASDSLIDRVTEITSRLPPDSVYISMRFNDVIAYYGGRSVFNYRRILRADPAIGQFDMVMYEACLVQTVDHLLEQNVPVYFIEEQSWNVSELMQKHFSLAEALPDLNNKIWAVSFSSDVPGQPLLPTCHF